MRGIKPTPHHYETDPDGNLHPTIPTWGAVGAECTNCYQTIDKAEGGRFYRFAGEYLCKSCLYDLFNSHKYARQGYCEICTAGFDDEAKAENFVKHTVLPYKGKLLCVDCIIEDLDTMSADDEAQE